MWNDRPGSKTTASVVQQLLAALRADHSHARALLATGSIFLVALLLLASTRKEPAAPIGAAKAVSSTTAHSPETKRSTEAPPSHFASTTE